VKHKAITRVIYDITYKSTVQIARDVEESGDCGADLTTKGCMSKPVARF